MNDADYGPQLASKAQPSSLPAAYRSCNLWSSSSSTRTPSAAPAAAQTPTTAHRTPNQPTVPTWSYRASLSSQGRPTPEPRLVSAVPPSSTARRGSYKMTRPCRVRVSRTTVAAANTRKSREWMRSPFRSLRKTTKPGRGMFRSNGRFGPIFQVRMYI